MGQEIQTIGDVIEILKRRKTSLILPALAVVIVALIVAFTWLPTYRSTATILIEEQEISRDFVVSSVTSYAEQRLQIINQRIMSTSKLLEIINRFNLYSEMRSNHTIDEIVGIMRKDIRLDTISGDVRDSRTGAGRSATIAFTLSYDGRRPQEVQEVTNVLVSLYLEENLKVRERQASGTSRFLEDEAKTVQADLGQIEGKIAAFKERNISALPELLNVNLQELDRIDREVEHLKTQLTGLKEREGYLQAQLASMPPTGSASQYWTLLKDLKAKLVQLETRYTQKNWEVIRTKEEIKELEERLKAEQAEQQTQKQKYRVAASDNMMYINLVSQLAGVQGDRESLEKQIQASTRQRQDYLKRVEATPSVDASLKALMVERNNTQAKYDDLMKKVMEARVAKGLEKEQMGERFTLIDPARLPQKPSRPNRPAILLIGAVLALGAGIGSASLREFTDTSVRTVRQLSAFVSVSVLATIPEIITWKDRQHSRRKRTTVAIGAVMIVIVAVVTFHLFVMDLDVFWAKMLRKLHL